MDRRTKVILLSIGSALLLGAVLWFIVWPLLKPLLPRIVTQPPPRQNAPPVASVPVRTVSSNASGTVGGGVFTYQTYEANPDIATINEMKQRAGVLAERAESGSSQEGFTNYVDAALNTTGRLSGALASKANDMRQTHPATGPLYLTIASRLVALPENDMKIAGNTFTVRVQLQVDVRDGEKRSTEYREATISFVLAGAQWLPDSYDVKPFSP